MFAYIKGRLAYKHNDYLVIEVGGIGYRVFTSLSSISRVGAVDGELKMHTYLHVREDISRLYGFCTVEELEIFELLIGVSGIGPKVAISVLSCMTPPEFSLAVITDDIKMLTKAQGVGKKTAQRIILELKDKIKKEQLKSEGFAEQGKINPIGNGSEISEAVNALIILGYTPPEASKAVSDVYTEGMELEIIIKNALKGLAGG